MGQQAWRQRVEWPAARVHGLSIQVLVILGLLIVWTVLYMTYWADLALPVMPFGDSCVPQIGPKVKTCIGVAVPEELHPPGI